MAVTAVRGVALCPEWELGNAIHSARLVDPLHQSTASLKEGVSSVFQPIQLVPLQWAYFRSISRNQS